MYESKIFSAGPLINSETCGPIRVPGNVVQVNPDSDPRAAVEGLPTEGGVISLAPGDYYNFGLGTHDHDLVAIVGESGPDGQRPVVHGPLWSSYRTGQVVYIANVEVAGDRKWETGINLQRHYKSELYPCLLILDNVYLHDFTGNGVWPSSVSNIELHDVELARSGGGNTRHNIYVGDETAALVIRGGHFHSANQSHPFKSKARRVLAAGARFETTSLWREYLEDPMAADLDRIFGTTLFDSVGNAEHHFVDCEFVSWKRRGTSDYMFEMQRRKTGRFGCDDPPYRVIASDRTYLPPQEQVLPQDLGEGYPMPDFSAQPFWDNDWWIAARAARAQLRSRFWRCRFRVAYRENPLNVVYALSNKGTLPIVDNGFTGIYDYPVPESWWERSYILVAPSCTYENMQVPDHIGITYPAASRPLLTDDQRKDPLISPRIIILPPDDAREERWNDRLPRPGEFSAWKYQAEHDRNMAVMRERFPLAQ